MQNAGLDEAQAGIKIARRDINNLKYADDTMLMAEITADGDCNQEIKRCLILGRKATTNLGQHIKKQRRILPIKVCIVKAMVFLVVMYRCESWTIKKAEC